MEMITIYEHSTAILGIASLIMGVTLYTLRNALNSNRVQSKSGLAFLAMAMIVLSVINLLEYTVGVDSQKEQHSLSIVVFAASIELFLIFMAYMSMLSKEFEVRRRIGFEIGCIALFTTPVLFVSPYHHPLLFDLLFAISVAFYCVKLFCNYFEYRKQMKKTKERVKNLLSDDSSVWLKWINRTFYVILSIGITSVAVPMTNLTVLVFYNLFLFFAYFYVYLSVIQKIFIFNNGMEILEKDEVGSSENERVAESLSQTNAHHQHVANFMDSRQKFLNDWIANRGYAVAGITATEVATHLKTNRSRLSYYLKNSLNTTYYEWIAKLRIEDAKRQLIDYPDKTIYEIALSVGIEDRDNFRRQFQKSVGVSPTAYRKQRGAGL